MNYVAVIKAKLLGATKTWVFKQADSNAWEWGDILRAGLYAFADKSLTIVILTMFSCEFLANPAPGRIPNVPASKPLHSIHVHILYDIVHSSEPVQVLCPKLMAPWAITHSSVRFWELL